MNKKFREIATEEGITWRFKDLRAGFATMLQLKGVELTLARKILGHQSVQTTMKHYTRISDKTAVEAVRKRLS